MLLDCSTVSEVAFEASYRIQNHTANLVRTPLGLLVNE